MDIKVGGHWWRQLSISTFLISLSLRLIFTHSSKKHRISTLCSIHLLDRFVFFFVKSSARCVWDGQSRTLLYLWWDKSSPLCLRLLVCPINHRASPASGTFAVFPVWQLFASCGWFKTSHYSSCWRYGTKGKKAQRRDWSWLEWFDVEYLPRAAFNMLLTTYQTLQSQHQFFFSSEINIKLRAWKIKENKDVEVPVACLPVLWLLILCSLMGTKCTLKIVNTENLPLGDLKPWILSAAGSELYLVRAPCCPSLGYSVY